MENNKEGKLTFIKTEKIKFFDIRYFVTFGTYCRYWPNSIATDCVYDYTYVESLNSIA